MTDLDSVLKSRDITLPTKVHMVKAIVFPVVMYGCESWTIKRAECQRIDSLKLWCWRRLLRVPWTARRSNQSILKEINPEYSLEGLMLKLSKLREIVKDREAWQAWHAFTPQSRKESDMAQWLNNEQGRKVGAGFRKEGTRVCLWPIHTNVRQNPSQCCKAIFLGLK